jgi:hypothetical protein
MWRRWLAILSGALIISIGLYWWDWAQLPIHIQQYQQAQHEHPTEQRTAHPEKTFWERTTDDPIAVFNLLLVLFTGVLAVSTIGLGIATYKLWRTSETHAGHMERSVKAAEDAAKAADASAKALPAMERAYLFLMPENIKFNIRELKRPFRDTQGKRRERDDWDIEEIDREIDVTFALTNYGRTPAIITAIHYDLKYFPHIGHVGLNKWPKIPHGRLEETLAITPIAPNVNSGEFQWRFAISHERWEAAQAADGHIIFWGRVVYEDVFNRRWETLFAWWYSWLDQRFVLAADNQANRRR